MNKVFTEPKYQNKQGYQGFPMDNLANFTSVAGYLYPIYMDILDPGDKVTIDNIMRSRTQPLTKPAMCTCIERMEWFAVPIDQLYKPFSTKFYGISDVSSDLLPQTGYNDTLPYVSLSDLHTFLLSRPTSFTSQAQIPVATPTQAEVKILCDCFGYGNAIGDSSITISTTNVFGPSVSALFPAAYQKIYYDHYRLTDWESNDVEAYNLDSFNTNMVINNTNRLNKLFALHKRPYQRDYFTSMKPSPLVGSADPSMAGVDLAKVNQWLTGLSKFVTSAPSSSTMVPSGGVVNASTTNPTSVGFDRTTNTSAASYNNVAAMISQVNPSNIRSMFAVEKLLEVTRRAKKHYDMQTLAHFGVEVPKGLAGECFKLGTFESYIQVGEVVSTADTVSSSTGSSLGTLAGRASSNNANNRRDKIHFESKCHCILMGIYSVEPVVNYREDGCQRINTMTSTTDFYKPEFDNLGEQPVFRYELLNTTFDPTNGTPYTDVLGWQKRYQQLKSKYNRSFGGVVSQYFNEWALNRTSISTTTFSRNFFQVWPTDLNNILQQHYTGSLTAGTCYSQDYFINQVYFDVKKTSKKSVFGVPNL